MFKGKTKIVQAIVMEKKNILHTVKPNIGMKLTRMKYGAYDFHNDKKHPKKRWYRVDFMTEKGKLSFDIDVATYSSMEINRLGLLEYKGSHLLSFKEGKIVTKEDVKKLGWQ